MNEFFILHLTDIEGYTPQLDDDLLQKLNFIVISGDISIGSKSVKYFLYSMKKIRKSIPDSIPIFYIPGNREYEYMAYELDDLPSNMISIHNRKYYFKLNNNFGIYLIGYGGALPGIFNNFIYSEDKINNDLIPIFKEVYSIKNIKDLVFFIVHNPPFKTKLDQAQFRRNVGSRAIRRLIEEFQPELCLCGHIHESSGIQNINKTICVNPGAGKQGFAGLISISDQIEVNIINIQVKR